MAASTPPWAATHVAMGSIGAPWGIKGWVKLHSYTNPPENLLDYRRFWLSGSRGLEEIEIDEARPHGRILVGHIKGCDVREASGRYTGRELLVEKRELPPLEEGYYWHQLVGLEVRNLAAEVLGKVDHLIETGANDVLVLGPAQESTGAATGNDQEDVDTKERLLPWIEGQVIREVNLDQGYILVDWDSDWD